MSEHRAGHHLMRWDHELASYGGIRAWRQVARETPPVMRRLREMPTCQLAELITIATDSDETLLHCVITELQLRGE